MQNQYPHVINSPKPKQLNAWRSNSVPNVYKNLNHRVNHFKSNLSGDIETNPGPVINSTKTIQAPYSQDNVAMFGLNAGTQCVAMSLASLIYNKRNGIVSSMDLVNMMNIGNELYSGLSSLSRQSYLLLTEVPEMIIVFNINYQLQYSPSYTGTIHGTCEVQDFNYCMSFANAMQALLGQNYNSFLLTILSTTVGFYCNGDGKFKIFDSHGRDPYGMPHPQGTCVLLEVNTLNELINYFQGLYQNPNVLFELKGVHINEKQCDMTDISYQQLSAVPLEANHADAEITTIHIPCCASSFCSICFSIIKYCGYWNSQTLDRITDHANKFYKEKLNGNNHPLTINNFPRTLQIYEADINIASNLKKQGILCCISLGSKLLLQKLITDNAKDNTRFLMWISNYCFSCIFQHNDMKTKAKSVKCYIIRFSLNSTLDIFEKMNDIDFLIQSLVDIVKKQFRSKDVEYCIKFICCSTNLSNAGRQKVMAKRKSHSQKELHAKRKKEKAEKEKLFISQS